MKSRMDNKKISHFNKFLIFEDPKNTLNADLWTAIKTQNLEDIEWILDEVEKDNIMRFKKYEKRQTSADGIGLQLEYLFENNIDLVLALIFIRCTAAEPLVKEFVKTQFIERMKDLNHMSYRYAIAMYWTLDGMNYSIHDFNLIRIISWMSANTIQRAPEIHDFIMF